MSRPNDLGESQIRRTLNKLGATIQRFNGDRRGNIAMMFAGAFVPVVAVSGMAIDYAPAQRIQTVMQTAADAASMAAATAAAPTTAQRITIATNVFNANAKLSRFNLSATPSVAVATGNVQVTANVNVPTAFMKIVGIDEVPLEVTSNAVTAGKTLELSLALDVTGSMAVSKLADMKWAAKDLMDIVMPVGGGNSPTKIALVPFSDRVNVGSLAPDVTGLPATRTTTSSSGRRGRRAARAAARQQPRISIPALPNARAPTDTRTTRRHRDATSARTIHGTEPAAGIRAAQTIARGPNSFPSLTIDNSYAIISTSSLSSGGTGGHIGTAWGMYTLSPNWNTTWTTDAPRAYDDDTNIKSVVIMTDGDYNTDYSSGYSSTQQALALCEAMKASDKKIVVYTIGFAIPASSPQRQTLMDCATSSDHYFFPYNGDELRSAFASIGQALTYAQGSPRIAD